MAAPTNLQEPDDNDNNNNDDDDNDPSITPPPNLFAEPPDYYQPPAPPTKTTHTLPTGETLSLSLIGHSPLWGHHLFPASRVLATYLHVHRARLCRGRSVLELGAGAGLPALAAARYGASRVLVTDYPDGDLVRNIAGNVAAAREALEVGRKRDGVEGALRIEARGYVWGRREMVVGGGGGEEIEEEEGSFDTLVLSDLVFNHSQHSALVKTVRDYLARRQESRALVFFTPHRPWLLDRDLAFFQVLEREGEGLVSEKVVDEKMDKVMFEGDRGDEEVRRTVLGWEVRWTGLEG